MRCVLESSSDCIKVLDLEGGIQFISPSGMRQLEAEAAAEILGKSYPDLFVGEWRHRADAAIQAAKEGKVSRFHGFFPTLKGTPKWWGVIVIPIGAQRGQTQQLLALSSDITDRVDAEERYRLASLAMNEGIYDLDIVSDQIKLSEAARVLFGYLDQTARGTEWWTERVHPDDTETVKASFTANLQGTNSEWSHEYRFRRANGEYAEVLERAFIVRDPDGRAIRMVGAMLDQTERKKTANQIQSLLSRLSNVLESTTDSVMVLDRKGRITYLNKRADAQLARGRQLIGERILKAEPELMESDFARAVVQTMNEGRPTEIKQFYAPLGQWIEAKTYPSEEGVTLFFRDVTDQYLAQEALKESQARLKLAQEAGKIGTWDMDLTTRDQVWSESMYSLFGWDPHGPPVNYQRFLDAVHPDDRADLLARARALLAGERPYDTQFRIIRPNGEIRWLATRGEVVRCEDGRPQRMYGVNYDVTEARRISDQLAEAKQVAEHASQAKTEFLASMSHEIRTPLHGIMGSTELLLADKDLTDGQRRNAERIATAGKALLTVVNDILDFSKMEVGQVDRTHPRWAAL
ncbi:PAS domain-containing protein [Microvirga tunisiensis]|nr:PAS domain-containing protein [Microvirga tunisiensis]